MAHFFGYVVFVFLVVQAAINHFCFAFLCGKMLHPVQIRLLEAE